MAGCTNCYDNCGQSLTVDKCVKYSGPDIACLDICQGDSLYTFEAAIAEKVCALLDGTGISPADVTVSCQFLIDILAGADPTLSALLQMLVTASCSLRDLITSLQEQIDDTYTFDLECLDLETSASKDEIIQALITKVCTLSTTVTTIEENYVPEEDFCDKVTECLNQGDVEQQYLKLSPYIAYDYHGPTNVFDINGAGILAMGYDKIYMCVGQTINSFTLPDYRGRTAVMANTGVPNTGMDTDVDPSLNPGYEISLNTALGNYQHTLTTAEMPEHDHDINDPGHSHDVDLSSTSGSDVFGRVASSSAPNVSTSTEVTGITLEVAGEGDEHNNTQPSLGSIKIMYVI